MGPAARTEAGRGFRRARVRLGAGGATRPRQRKTPRPETCGASCRRWRVGRVSHLPASCATLLFRNGRNAKQVQKYLGHSGPGFTLRTYVHLLDDDLDSPDFMEAMTSEGGQQMGNTTRRNGARSEPSEGLGIPQDKPKTLGSSLP